MNTSELFAIHPSYVDRLRSQVSVRDRFQRPEAYVTNAAGDRFAANSADVRRQSKAVAIVPLWGVIGQYPSWRVDTATEAFIKDFRKLDAAASVGTIIILTNSPGGSVYGVQEASDAVFAARKRNQTRIIQVVNSLSASAAEWIGTAAHERIVTPGGEVGSIGVISIYLDASKALEQDGYAATVVRTPASKARFTGIEPASEDMIATMQQRNREAYGRFTAAIARNRGVSQSTVVERFGGGETLNAREALACGFVDAIASFDDVVTDAVAGRRTSSGRRSAVSNPSSRHLAARAKLRLLEVE